MGKATIRVRLTGRVTVRQHVRVTRSIRVYNPYAVGWDHFPALPDGEPEEQSPDIDAPEVGTEQGEEAGDTSENLG